MWKEKVLITIRNTGYTALTNEDGTYTIDYNGRNNKPVIEVNHWGLYTL